MLRQVVQNRLTGIAVATAVGIAVVAFVAFVFGVADDNEFFRSYDVREVFAYQKDFYRDALLDGRLPLWNPHVFSGWPFLANPQAQVFYPTSLLFLWLPQPQALILELLFHLFLVLAGTYGLARVSYRLSVGPSILAAMTFAMSGTIFGHVFRGHPHIIMSLAYIPLLSLLIDRAAMRLADDLAPRDRTLPRNVFNRFRLGLRRAGPWPWLAGLLLALQILTGGLQMVWLGLVVIGISRLCSLVLRTPLVWRAWWREGFLLVAVSVLGISPAAVQVLPSYELAGLSSRPAQDIDYAATSSFAPGLLSTMVNPRARSGGQPAPGGNYAYTGVLTLGLAIPGLFMALRRRRLAPVVVTGMFFFVFMFGKHTALFPWLFAYVPSFDIFRAPARAMAMFHLALALLAAVGLEGILRRCRRNNGWRQWMTIVLTVCACAITWIDLTVTAQWQRDALVFAESTTPEDPVQLTHARILERDSSWYRYWFYPNALRDNHAYALHARSAGGYDVMLPGRYERFIRFMTDSWLEKPGLTRLNPQVFRNSPSPFPFKILGIRYADFNGQLLARTDPLPVVRAWLVTQTRIVADEEAALRTLRSAEFQPSREVLIEAADQGSIAAHLPSVTPKLPAPRVVVTERRPELLEIELGPHPAGILVFSEVFYPGWQASTGGHELPIFRCNAILRCLRLDGSPETVRMRMEFRPAALRYGGLISLGSLSLVVFALIFSLSSGRVSGLRPSTR